MKNEKAFTLLTFAFAGSILVYLILSSFGLTNTFFGWDARQTPWWWKLIAGSGLAVSALFGWLLHSNRIQTSRGTNVIIGVAIALSLLSGAQFKGTAGDIKQRISFIDLNGKISDIEGFTKYYKDFYHLDTDTALVNYINTYRELPGVNHWAFNICCALPASTRHPRSTAPRADEYFEWHTGAYEMDLNDK